MEHVLRHKTQKSESHWISISDIMSGLMMIFMFISISYMIDIKDQKDQIHTIATTYKSLKKEIYEDLKNEFKNDFKRWRAEIPANTLTIAFRDHFAQFTQGKAVLNLEFKEILEDFFPRYVRIIMKYYPDIEELRIEGHTSSEWHNGASKDIAYFENMKLSQSRTRSVLAYLMRLNTLNGYKDKIFKRMTANGLSSSRIILNEDGTENKEASRRVEFVIRTNSELRINKILNIGDEK